MASYKLSPEAESDLYRIWLYGVHRWNFDAADEYQRALYERFEEIATNPMQFPVVEHIRQGYRRSVFRNDSIYYRVNRDMVEIMAVLGKQNLDAWL